MFLPVCAVFLVTETRDNDNVNSGMYDRSGPGFSRYMHNCTLLEGQREAKGFLVRTKCQMLHAGVFAFTPIGLESP